MKARLKWTNSNMADDTMGGVSSSTGDSSQTGGKGTTTVFQDVKACFVIAKVIRPGLLFSFPKRSKSINYG